MQVVPPSGSTVGLALRGAGESPLSQPVRGQFMSSGNTTAPPSYLGQRASTTCSDVRRSAGQLRRNQQRLKIGLPLLPGPSCWRYESEAGIRLGEGASCSRTCGRRPPPSSQPQFPDVAPAAVVDLGGGAPPAWGGGEPLLRRVRRVLRHRLAAIVLLALAEALATVPLRSRTTEPLPLLTSEPRRWVNRVGATPQWLGHGRVGSSRF